MHNLGTLYLYEIKKIIKKKLLWITLLLCMIGIAFTVLSSLFGTYYMDGNAIDTNYHMFLVDKEYRENLSGRTIDQELLQEMSDAYRQIPAGSDQYTLTEEYQTYARPYSDIFNIVRSWTDMDAASVMTWQPDEEALYKARHDKLESSWEAKFLSDAEKDFWRNREKQIETPLTYIYHEGYGAALESFLTVGVLMLLFVAICLSGIYPEEHTRRTDQLLLSSTNGRSIIYWAKLLAGITISVACALLMTTVTIAMSLLVYGHDGFHTAFQIFRSTSSSPITLGQACLIAYGILIIAAIFISVFVMVVSELLHSNIVALSITTGLIIAGMLIQVPGEYRFLSQLWDYLPTSFLAVWNIFDHRLITIFGQAFVSWQIVPVVYILCSIILAIFGNGIYKRYQVSGR